MAILLTSHEQLVDKEKALQVELEETKAKLHVAQEAARHHTAHLQRFLQAFQPARRGNLHVRAIPPSGELGQLAEFCNAVLEELTIVIGSARHSSQQVQTTTTTLLASVVALAQAAETQLYRIASTTEAMGALVSFLQRLEGTLTPSLEHLSRLQDALIQPNVPLSLLHEEIRTQIQLLRQLLPATQAQTRQAESLFENLSTCTSHLSQTETPLLQLAEQIDLLSRHTQKWSQALQLYQIPEPTLPSAPPTPMPITPIWEAQGTQTHSLL